MNLENNIKGIVKDIGYKLIKPLFDASEFVVCLTIPFFTSKKYAKKIAKIYKNKPILSTGLIMFGSSIISTGIAYGAVALAEYFKN